MPNSPADPLPATPAPYEHPADLVIDVFGTFLGKRSERLVVRWREWVDQTTETEAANDQMETNNQQREAEREPLVLRFPGNEPSHNNEQADTEAKTSSSEMDKDSQQSGHNDPAEQAARQLLSFWGSQRRRTSESEPSSRQNRAGQRQNRLKDRLTALAGDTDTTDEEGGRGGWQQREVPFSRLRSVIVAGRGITLSSDLVDALVQRGIQLSFLSGRGMPIAHLSAPALGATVQTRRAQLAAYSAPLGLELAATFIDGKLRNQRHCLRYFAKYLKSADPNRYERVIKKAEIIGKVRGQLKQQVEKRKSRGRSSAEGNASAAPCIDDIRNRLMGLEGTGGRVYWEAIAIILEGRVEFSGRVTRGATDPVNAALNYGYGILYSQVQGAVINAGLEPYAGFLHVDRPGKPSLVLDLVEEFRAPVVDQVVLAIINQGITLNCDPYGLTKSSRRILAERVLERLDTLVPFEGKRYPLRHVIQMQARHIATAVRGERTYKPFASRW